MSVRRAVGRGAAGRDTGPRRSALAGGLASIDATDSVDLVREWRPACGRVQLWSWRRVGGAGWCVLCGSWKQARNAAPGVR